MGFHIRLSWNLNIVSKKKINNNTIFFKIGNFFCATQATYVHIYLEFPVRDLSSCLGDISVPFKLDNKTSFIMVRSSYEINSNNTIR